MAGKAEKIILGLVVIGLGFLLFSKTPTHNSKTPSVQEEQRPKEEEQRFIQDFIQKHHAINYDKEIVRYKEHRNPYFSEPFSIEIEEWMKGMVGKTLFIRGEVEDIWRTDERVFLRMGNPSGAEAKGNTPPIDFVMSCEETKINKVRDIFQNYKKWKENAEYPLTLKVPDIGAILEVKKVSKKRYVEEDTYAEIDTDGHDGGTIEYEHEIELALHSRQEIIGKCLAFHCVNCTNFKTTQDHPS